MTHRSLALARHLRRHRLGRLAAALTAVAALVLGAPAGAWAVDGPPETLPVTFTMAPHDRGIVTADQPVTITTTVHNPSESTIASRALKITTSSTPLATRSELDAWFDTPGGDATRTERTISETTLPGVAGHGTAVVDMSIDAATLADLGAGVYPLRADYAGPQGTLSAFSVLVVSGEPGTGELGVIVPITAPALGTGLLDASQLATLTASGGALRARLDAVTGTSAILAVDPAIVAAIRVLGSSAPATAVRWLDDLMTLPNSRFALQFGDADLATQIGAGLSDPLTVATLDPYLSSSESTATPTPAPTATDAATEQTTLERMTDVRAAPGSVFWPATGTAGGEVVAALGSLTTDDVPSITLLDSSAVASDAPAAWATAGDARVLVYDAAASSALGVAAASTDVVTRYGALAEASAYAALATTDHPDATLVVAVDRSGTGSAASIAATVAAATSLSGRTATDLAALTSGTASAISLKSVPADAARVDQLNALLSDEVTLTSFATILADPAVLTVPERASILQLLGNGWRSDTTGAADAFAAHRAQTQTTLASVAVVQPSDITFAATSAPLQFSVRNDLEWPVSLVLITTQNDPRLIVQNTTPVEAGAAQITRVQVPVEARVGSGESSVTLQLRSPTMIAIGDPVSVHVSVRAEWESVGLVVLIVIVAGLIIVGIIRTVRRRRRGDVGAEAEGTDGGADATDAAEEASADAFLESTDVTEERTDG